MPEDPRETTTTAETEVPVDEGFRRWYASCPCCLGESYPKVKAAIEAERRKGSG